MIFLSEWIPPTLDKNLVQRLMDSMARKVLVMNHPPNRPRALVWELRNSQLSSFARRERQIRALGRTMNDKLTIESRKFPWDLTSP